MALTIELKELKKYLSSIENRGIVFDSTGRAAVPSSVLAESPQSRVPANLPGVSETKFIKKLGKPTPGGQPSLLSGQTAPGKPNASATTNIPQENTSVKRRNKTDANSGRASTPNY